MSFVPALIAGIAINTGLVVVVAPSMGWAATLSLVPFLLLGSIAQRDSGWGHLRGRKGTSAILTTFTHMQSINTLRDLRLFKLDRKRILVVSCDSAGGIGPKPFDNVKVSGSVVGKFTARVALMEALSVGALPFCITVALSVEPKPTGAQILNGIRSELRHASLTLPITLQSSEKNFEVKQTGLGITILSIASPRSLRMKTCERGDAVMAIGTPQVGEEVVSGERKRGVSDTRDVRRLLKISVCARDTSGRVPRNTARGSNPS